jgi:glutamine amidotransferase
MGDWRRFFARELRGRLHVFAHNGRLEGIESRHAGERDRFQPVGETDSEIAFCILLERLGARAAAAKLPVSTMVKKTLS